MKAPNIIRPHLTGKQQQHLSYSVTSSEQTQAAQQQGLGSDILTEPAGYYDLSLSKSFETLSIPAPPSF